MLLFFLFQDRKSGREVRIREHKDWEWDLGLPKFRTQKFFLKKRQKYQKEEGPEIRGKPRMLGYSRLGKVIFQMR